MGIYREKTINKKNIAGIYMDNRIFNELKSQIEAVQHQKQFFFPICKEIHAPLVQFCTHCHTQIQVTQADLYYHDNPNFDSVSCGWIAVCPVCGSRISINISDSLASEKVSSSPSNNPFVLSPEQKTVSPPVASKKHKWILPLVLLFATAVVLFAVESLFSKPTTNLSNESSTSVSGGSMSSASNDTPNESEVETDTSSDTPKLLLANVPASIQALTQSGSKPIQGLEWNTDTLDKVYFSYPQAITCYHEDSKPQDIISTNSGRFGSLSYYDGKLFTIWRSDDCSQVELYILNANDLNDYRHISLPEFVQLRDEDSQTYHAEEQLSFVDAIEIAPKFGGGGDKIYIAYASYDTKSKRRLSLRSQQYILEYDYQDMLSSSGSAYANRILTVDLDDIKFGIQTLEYDPDSGNMWCAVRKANGGAGDLYCLDGNSKGEILHLASINGKQVWNCKAAGDGLVALGDNCYYLIDVNYDKTEDTTTASAYRTNLTGLIRN